MTADKFTKWILGVEVTFSLIGGLVLLLGGVFMADAVGVSGWIISGVGVFVEFVWTLILAMAGSRKHVTQRELERIIKGNIIWVVLSLIVIAIPGSMTSGGKIALGVIALIVTGFAIAQIIGRKRLMTVGWGEAGTDQPAPR